MKTTLFPLGTLALGLAGCTGDLEMPVEPELVEPVAAAVYAAPREGMETNTPYLLGAVLDRLGAGSHHLHVGSVATDTLGRTVAVAFTGAGSLAGIDHAGKLHVAADPWFVGVELAVTPAPGTVKILAVRTEGPLAVYTIRHRTSPSAAWVDPCGGSEAVVHAGRWLRDGRHEPADDRVTFACANAAAGECSLWGYVPGSDPSSPGWAGNVACTRMLRADRCGDGVSTTVEGTPIKFYDRLGINTPPPPSFPPVTSWPPAHGAFFFDGAWSREAMTCGGKARWQSLAIGGSCPTILPDPRVSSSAAFCNENAPPTGPEVLFISTSVYNQVGLHAWSDGQDTVVTTRGFYAMGAIVQPFGTPYAHAGFEGLLLRDVPASIAATEVVQVNMYRGPNGDRVVTTAARAPIDYVEDGTEGFVYTSERPGTIPLREYTNGLDRITTTRIPGSAYTPLGTVGWVTSL